MAVAASDGMQSNQSVWKQMAAPGKFPKLENDLAVDVAVVGGGITGLTAAVLLARAGKRVALLEAQRLGDGTSGDTTGHLTQILDDRYHQLEKSFGRDATKAIARSVAASIDQIEALAKRGRHDSGFERVEGLLFTEHKKQRDELGGELEACLRAGLDVAPVTTAPLPFAIASGLRIRNQAQLSIYPYLAGLAEQVVDAGGEIFEGTRVAQYSDGEPCTLTTADGRTVRASHVILATHSPLNVVFLQTKISHYQSYVVSGPGMKLPNGLYWDMDDPYHYVRTVGVDGHRELVVGGADHKTGQGSPHAAFEDISRYAARFSVMASHRWSHQVVEPCDGLPFIGRNSNSKHVFVATGFSGTGLTFGTLAAMILSDACLGLANPYAELYSATRIKPVASMPDYVKENVDFPLHRLTDPLRPGEVKSAEEIGRGSGKILRAHGERLAVFRDLDGGLHCVSAKCTHLGCHVAFNSAESTWDCPCHGSRFTPDGDILDGPAMKPLPPRKL
jgi:glycine/D-amino acid oxidase-like deaminating enzyme/nitrite reductase/ring-hydroxylating ferredoxin subunit